MNLSFSISLSQPCSILRTSSKPPAPPVSIYPKNNALKKNAAKWKSSWNRTSIQTQGVGGRNCKLGWGRMGFWTGSSSSWFLCRRSRWVQILYRFSNQTIDVTFPFRRTKDPVRWSVPKGIWFFPAELPRIYLESENLRDLFRVEDHHFGSKNDVAALPPQSSQSWSGFVFLVETRNSFRVWPECLFEGYKGWKKTLKFSDSQYPLQFLRRFVSFFRWILEGAGFGGSTQAFQETRLRNSTTAEGNWDRPPSCPEPLVDLVCVVGFDWSGWALWRMRDCIEGGYMEKKVPPSISERWIPRFWTRNPKWRTIWTGLRSSWILRLRRRWGWKSYILYPQFFMFPGTAVLGPFPRDLGTAMPTIVFYALENPPVGHNLTS